MVVKFKVLEWAQSLVGLFLVSAGTARGPSGAKCFDSTYVKLALSYILIRNTSTYNFLLA